MAAATQELGLVGLGGITLAPSAGVMQRETFRQNETRNGVDPTTGQPLLHLQQFDVTWPEGRIGEWVRHCRPDVLAEAKAISDQQARGSSLNLRAMWTYAKANAEAQVQAEPRAEPDQDKD